MRTRTKILLTLLLLTMLVPATAIAQRNRSSKRKAQKPKTETVTSSQDTTIKNEQEDVNKGYTLSDEDDSNYTSSAEHNTKIDEFLNTYINNGNTQIADNAIKNYINHLSDGQKKSFNANILDRIGPMLEQNHYAASLALINLYQAHSSKSNKMMPMLYYIKGNIYTSLRDTTGIKEAIKALSEYKEGEEFITMLSDGLNSIRSYKPDLNDLEGSWITDLVSKQKPEMPLIFFDNTVHGGSIESVIRKNSPINKIIAQHMSLLGKSSELPSSQLIIPYASDSIYIAWCNEKITGQNAFVTSLLRESVSITASHIEGILNQRNSHSSTASVLGSLGTTAAEIGLNALIDGLFTPTKKIYFIEAKLRIYNRYMMKGKVKLILNRVSADGSSSSNDYEWNSIIYKWQPDSKIAFCGSGINLPLGLDKKAFEDDETTSYSLCSHGADYNNEMTRQIALYNYWKMYNIGTENLDTLFKSNLKKPFLGVRYEVLSQEDCKKYGISNGIKILETFKSSPAHIYGLKKGDIIDIDTGSFKEYRSGQNIKLRYFRGKKEHSLNLKLSFLFIPQYERWWGFEYTLPIDANYIVVSKVYEDSPAEKAGLKTGDCVEKINGTQVVDAGDVVTSDGYKHVLDKYNYGETINIQIKRGNKRKEVKLKIGSVNTENII